jgi:hypothetical protein
VLNSHKYNESLVRCGEYHYLFLMSLIDRQYFDGMNEGKKELLLTDIRIHSFVQLLGYMRVYFIYHTDKLKVLLSGLMLMTGYHLYQTIG